MFLKLAPAIIFFLGHVCATCRPSSFVRLQFSRSLYFFSSSFLFFFCFLLGPFQAEFYFIIYSFHLFNTSVDIKLLHLVLIGWTSVSFGEIGFTLILAFLSNGAVSSMHHKRNLLMGDQCHFHSLPAYQFLFYRDMRFSGLISLVKPRHFTRLTFGPTGLLFVQQHRIALSLVSS